MFNLAFATVLEGAVTRVPALGRRGFRAEFRLWSGI